MGTFKVSRLSDEEVCARYAAGESRTLIALKCKMPDQHVRNVLLHYGIALRTPEQVKSMIGAARNVGSRRRKRNALSLLSAGAA